MQYDYTLYLVSALEGTSTSVTVLVNLMEWTFGAAFGLFIGRLRLCLIPPSQQLMVQKASKRSVMQLSIAGPSHCML